MRESIEIHRSTRLADCEERAFVLTAVGVPNEIGRDGERYVLWVDAQLAAEAGTHLQRFEAESRTPPPAPAPPAVAAHPQAWVGTALYAAVLFGVSYAIAAGAGRLDAFALGELDAARVQDGEWWRAVTALTLHRDVAHLAANLGFGACIAHLAAQRLGPGTAWAAIVGAAAAANLLNALVGPPVYRSVGASTAVFAALGVLAAHTWRERHRITRRWAVRWGPLVAGVVLLGWMGSQGEHTDLVAHATGFAIGALVGAAIAALRARTARRVPQWLAGAATALLLALAWTRALS